MTERQSLGYWLVETGVRPSGTPGQEYRGLDRYPDLPGPDRDTALQEDGRSRLLEARNRYWDLEDSGELQRDSGTALRVRDDLRLEGYPIEVVLADLLPPAGLDQVPDDLRDAYREGLVRWCVEPGPADAKTQRLGIDVSFPFPTFHSALRQPVSPDVSSLFVNELNAFGLLSDLDVANRTGELANARDSAWRPLCPVSISLIGEG